MMGNSESYREADESVQKTVMKQGPYFKMLEGMFFQMTVRRTVLPQSIFKLLDMRHKKNNM